MKAAFNKPFVFHLFLAIFYVVIDQVTKVYVATHFLLGESVTVIDGFFNLTYVRNSGAAFGFGHYFDDWIRGVLFKVIPVVACFFLVFLLYKSSRVSKLNSTIYSLILGGAVGNIIDRIRLDYVIDFFDFYQRRISLPFMSRDIINWHFATFNIADTCISIAAVLMIYEILFNKKKS